MGLLGTLLGKLDRIKICGDNNQYIYLFLGTNGRL
jgi:hypothetical protein